MYYRKKPVVIEAFMVDYGADESQGDYVIKGIRGEIYPCKLDIFLDSYEQVAANPT